jgi:hypothetical protein
MTWLTPGLVEGDNYECRNCGSNFIVGSIPENLSPLGSYNSSEP